MKGEYFVLVGTGGDARVHSGPFGTGREAYDSAVEAVLRTFPCASVVICDYTVSRTVEDDRIKAAVRA